MIARYLAANHKILNGTVLTTLENPIHAKLSARLKDPHNILTKKIKILHYLVESESRHVSQFTNLKPQRLKALGLLLSLPITLLYRFIKAKRSTYDL